MILILFIPYLPLQALLLMNIGNSHIYLVFGSNLLRRSERSNPVRGYWIQAELDPAHSVAY
jgi:hypothetical protein